MVVLVTGASGQLGQSLQSIAQKYPEIAFVFCDSKTLDITKPELIEQVFNQFQPDFCINAAAYTAVDKAESEPQQARLINVVGAKNIAEACKKFDSVLLHISTDFVFDGTKNSPYNESDSTHPKGVYGQTKLEGEIAIQEAWHKHIIIRTSWVYSQFGHNFMKTMLRLATERSEISVVNDQTGTPTHAIDLAEVLVKICTSIFLPRLRDPSSNFFGIFHFSNEGQCTWYDFAKAIFAKNQLDIKVSAIPTSSFPTPAQRPAYSVLDKSKIKSVFGVEINTWETSLKNM
ncbi:MAG: dTDP-4-dehydrorhamnose reductase [Flavobacterium sp.]